MQYRQLLRRGSGDSTYTRESGSTIGDVVTRAVSGLIARERRRA